MSDPVPPNPRTARWKVSQTAVTGAWKEKRRLAAAMRTVISRLVEIEAPEAELAAAADRLERYAARLASHPRPNRYEGWAEASASITMVRAHPIRPSTTPNKSTPTTSSRSSKPFATSVELRIRTS